MRAAIESVLMRAWQRRGLVACALWPLSKLFGALVNFRFGLLMLGYQAQTKLAVPVIVVGNIFVGGTGKTPLVIWLVEQLRLAGKIPGVISRGYGAHAETVQAVQLHSLAAQVGDEPLLIASRAACPVFVGRHRVAAAQALLQAHPAVDVIISDDGLQHYALVRDVEIVLFDQRGAGNGWLLPAGPLRETVKRRRDFTIINATGGMPQGDLGVGATAPVQMHLHAEKLYRLGDPAQQQSMMDLIKSDAKIAAVAGIGNPQRFFNMLAAAGVQLKGYSLADHQVFAADSFAVYKEALILITEKDAVKCRQIPALVQDSRIWVVPVSAQLDVDFAARLLAILSEKFHGRSSA